MPIVIDSLIVNFGLDASGFKKGEREVRDSLKRTGEDVRRQAGETEEQARSTTSLFSTARNQVLGYLGAFLGLRGIERFVDQTTRANAETGRTAAVLNLSANQLAAWRGVAEAAGGSANGITSAMAGLVGKFQDFAVTLQNDTIPWFRSFFAGSNTDIAQFLDNAGRIKDINELMLAIAKRSKELGRDAATPHLRAFGMDQETINLMLKGDAVLRELLAKQAQIAQLTNADTEAAGRLLEAWTKLAAAIQSIGSDLTTYIAAPLTKILNTITEILAVFRTPGGAAKAAGYSSLVPFFGPALSQVFTALAARAKEREGEREQPGAPNVVNPPAPAPGTPPTPTGRSAITGEQLVTISTASGKRVTVSAAAANDFKGFLDALEAKGAPIGYVGGYGVRKIAGTNAWSEHSKGQAIDMGSMRGRDQIDPALRAWINSHPAEWRELLARYHMRSGGDWRNPDLGHVEWKASEAASSAAGAAVSAAMRQAPAPSGPAPGAGTAAGLVWTDNRTGARTSTSTSETNIGTINVNAPRASDAEGIAREIKPALERNSVAGQVNFGAN